VCFASPASVPGDHVHHPDSEYWRPSPTGVASLQHPLLGFSYPVIKTIMPAALKKLDSS